MRKSLDGLANNIYGNNSSSMNHAPSNSSLNGELKTGQGIVPRVSSEQSGDPSQSQFRRTETTLPLKKRQLPQEIIAELSSEEPITKRVPLNLEKDIPTSPIPEEANAFFPESSFQVFQLSEAINDYELNISENASVDGEDITDEASAASEQPVAIKQPTIAEKILEYLAEYPDGVFKEKCWEGMLDSQHSNLESIQHALRRLIEQGKVQEIVLGRGKTKKFLVVGSENYDHAVATAKTTPSSSQRPAIKTPQAIVNYLSQHPGTPRNAFEKNLLISQKITPKSLRREIEALKNTHTIYEENNCFYVTNPSSLELKYFGSGERAKQIVNILGQHGKRMSEGQLAQEAGMDRRKLQAWVAKEGAKNGISSKGGLGGETYYSLS